jgi:hypothetical protein
VFACEKFRSYITDSKVRIYTDRKGLKEILERTDVKPRMIRWILLLQEFDLQILQRNEEQFEDEDPPDEEAPQWKVAVVCVPLGTLRLDKGFSPILRDGVCKHLLPTIYEGKGRIT